MQNIVNLSEVVSEESLAQLIEILLENGKPILIEIPPDMNVWGISNKLDSLSEDIWDILDDSLSLHNWELHETNQARIEANKVASEISSSQIIQDAKYLPVPPFEVSNILSGSSISVDSAPSVVVKAEEGLKLKCEYEGLNFKHDYQTINKNNQPATEFKSLLKRVSLVNSEEIKFVLAPKNFQKTSYGLVPIMNLKSLTVDINDLFVFEEDIEEFKAKPKLIFEVPPKSIFYIEPDIDSPELRELSKFAYNFLLKNINYKSKDIARAHSKYFDGGVKKSASAAYFLHPRPKLDTSKISSKLNSWGNTCQFLSLVEAYKEFWAPQSDIKKLSQEEYKNIIQAVMDYFKLKNYSDDNAKYGELLIRPPKK